MADINIAHDIIKTTNFTNKLFDYGNFKTIWRVLIYQKKRSKSTKNTMDEIHAWHESNFIIGFYFCDSFYFIQGIHPATF